MERRFQIKPTSSYSLPIQRELKLLQVDRNNSMIQVIGSASYRKTLFAGDIDFFERVLGQSKDEIIEFFIRNLQRVVKNILKSKHHYFMEVKAGVDNRFKIPVGTCHNDHFIIDPSLVDTINEYSNYGLFNQYETFALLTYSREKNQIAYETIKQIIRNHYVVRWTAKEILKGHKKLPLREEPFTLYEAINVKSPMNIEIIADVNGKFSDVSNFFYVGYEEDGKMYYVNMPDQAAYDFDEFFKENLRGSIEKLAFSKLEPNYFKLCKRYFSFARFTRDNVLLEKAQFILNSELGVFYQIKSETGTLIKLIEQEPKLAIKILKNQLQSIKYRIANVLSYSKDELDHVNQIFDTLTKIGYDPKKITHLLKAVKERLTNLIETNTMTYLKKVGLFPPPNSLLPQKREF